MKSKNKKVVLLFAGGTTISDKDIAGSTANQPSDMESWLGQIPEISLMAEVEPVFVGARQELPEVELWQKLSQKIYEKFSSADGFVVLNDVNSILTTGIALSFALKNFNKPVILTGSQITPEAVKLPDWPAVKAKAYGGLGVKANLINAVQLATMNVPAVALMFGNRIIRAVKARRGQVLGLNIFKSIDDSYLGKIDFGISLTEKFGEAGPAARLENKFEPKIKIYDYFPGLDLKDLKGDEARGKIIRDLPDLNLLKNYNGKIPLMAHNRFLFGSSEKDKVLIINNLTWETALVKFMWALGQSNNIAEVRGFMFNEHCQEFIR